MTNQPAVRCSWCKGVIQAALPGHEQDLASHGIHPGDCVEAYRAWAGLPPLPHVAYTVPVVW